MPSVSKKTTKRVGTYAPGVARSKRSVKIRVFLGEGEVRRLIPDKSSQGRKAK